LLAGVVSDRCACLPTVQAATVNCVRAPGGIIVQFALLCSKSVNRCRRARNSRCIWVVAVPTKKKHIGRNAKNAGRHQPESGEPTDANRAMSEIKAQNAAGIQ